MTQLIWSGVVVGTIYALIGLSLNVIYRVTNVVNFAQGEVMTFGALLAYTGVILWGWPWWLVIPLVLVGSMALGVVIDWLGVRTVWHFGSRDSHNWLLTTFGIAVLIQSGIQLIWGRFDLPAATPVPRGVVRTLGMGMGYREIAIVATGVLLVASMEALNRSAMGKASQAAAESPDGAAIIGIDVSRLITYTWMGAAAISAITGLLAAPILVLNAFMGFHVIVKVFAVVIIGGLGSPRGAIVAGYGLGIFEFVMSRAVPGGYVDALVFAAVIAMLYFRPSGLFGQAQIERA